MNDDKYRRSVDDICAGSERVPASPTIPHAAPIYPTSVWQCASTQQAERLLAAEESGYVYQRDGHPNAELFARKAAELQGAEQAAVTASGMAALSLALLSCSRAGDQLVASNQLYGRSTLLLGEEAQRLGIECIFVDPTDPDAFAEAVTDRTRILIVETISNPVLRLADLPRLAGVAQQHDTLLLVDNTFATPALCRPLEFGADLVLESVSKMMNGHSDVMLGLLAGKTDRVDWQRVHRVNAAWGLASSPFDCWLASRGLSTLALRMRQASSNALRLAEMLEQHPAVQGVIYPGLASHPDHNLARELLDDAYGSMVTFHVRDRQTVDHLIQRCGDAIPFCPSLGEISTTISHPASTSHRTMPLDQRKKLGIHGGTIRLSVGIESLESLSHLIDRALDEG